MDNGGIRFVVPDDCKKDPKAFQKHIGQEMLSAEKRFGPNHEVTRNLADIASHTRDAKNMAEVQTGLMAAARTGNKVKQPNSVALDLYSDLSGHGKMAKPQMVQGGVKAAYGDHFKLQPKQKLEVVIDGIGMTNERHAVAESRRADLDWVAGAEAPSARLGKDSVTPGIRPVQP